MMKNVFSTFFVLYLFLCWTIEFTYSEEPEDELDVEFWDFEEMYEWMYAENGICSRYVYREFTQFNDRIYFLGKTWFDDLLEYEEDPDRIFELETAKNAIIGEVAVYHSSVSQYPFQLKYIKNYNTYPGPSDYEFGYFNFFSAYFATTDPYQNQTVIVQGWRKSNLIYEKSILISHQPQYFSFDFLLIDLLIVDIDSCDFFIDNITISKEIGVDLSVKDVDIAQVTWNPDINGDNRIDLVHSRRAKVRVEIDILDPVDPITREPTVPDNATEDFLNQKVIVSLYEEDVEITNEEKTLGTILNDFENEKCFLLNYQESELGDHDLKIIVNPVINPQTEEREILEYYVDDNEAELEITVKKTRPLNIAYIPVKLGYVQNEGEPNQESVINIAVISLIDLYRLFPLSVNPHGYTGYEYGKKVLIKRYETCPSINDCPDNILLLVSLNIARQDMNNEMGVDYCERSVGIVTRNYFYTHNLIQTVGYCYPGIDSAVVVCEGYPGAVVHELGHSYGIIEHNNVTSQILSGYNIWTDSIVNEYYSFIYENIISNYWISDDEYKYLFNKLNAGSPNDPNILILSGFINLDGSISLLEWFARNSGFVEYPKVANELIQKYINVQILNDKGIMIDEISIPLSFYIYYFGQGLVETNSAPFSFSIEYPKDAMIIRFIDDGTVIQEINITIKLLRDAVDNLSENCIKEGDIDSVKNELYKSIDDLEVLLTQRDKYGAIDKLQIEIIDKINSLLLEDCTSDDPLTTTKSLFLQTVDMVLHRIENQDDPPGVYMVNGDGVSHGEGKYWPGIKGYFDARFTPASIFDNEETYPSWCADRDTNIQLDKWYQNVECYSSLTASSCNLIGNPDNLPLVDFLLVYYRFSFGSDNEVEIDGQTYVITNNEIQAVIWMLLFNGFQWGDGHIQGGGIQWNPILARWLYDLILIEYNDYILNYGFSMGDFYEDLYTTFTEISIAVIIDCGDQVNLLEIPYWLYKELVTLGIVVDCP